jgi:hypothetical protein
MYLAVLLDNERTIAETIKEHGPERKLWPFDILTGSLELFRAERKRPSVGTSSSKDIRAASPFGPSLDALAEAVGSPSEGISSRLERMD